jgi:hypothetical protein
MAYVTGKDGKVTVGANALPVDSWSLSRTRGVADVTAFGSSFVDRLPTIKDWSVSIGGTFNTTNAVQLSARDQLEDGAAADLAIELRTTSSTAGAKFTGNVVVTGDVVTSAVADKVSWSLDGQGNGAIAWVPAT